MNKQYEPLKINIDWLQLQDIVTASTFGGGYDSVNEDYGKEDIFHE